MAGRTSTVARGERTECSHGPVSGAVGHIQTIHAPIMEDIGPVNSFFNTCVNLGTDAIGLPPSASRIA